MAEPTRETLLMRLRNSRDELSWEEFTDAYERYIYLLIRGMQVGHHDAEDLVQVVLLAMWKELPNFEYLPKRSKFRTWLCRITRNKVVDYIRRSTSETSKLSKMSHEVTAIPEIEKLAEREWRAHVADRAWENIQQDFSDDVLSCFTQSRQGIGVDEVARNLGVSQSSVYVYNKRIKDRLIKEIRNLDWQWS